MTLAARFQRAWLRTELVLDGGQTAGERIDLPDALYGIT